MMRRRIFLWIGLSVLFAWFGICREGLARETYQVLNGDTLSSISGKIGVTVDALKAANHLKGSRLKPRQILVIPTPAANTSSRSKKSSLPGEEVYRVSKGDTLARIAKKTGISVVESAALLGNWNNPDEQKLLVKVAMGFLGAPYRLGGYSVTGLDCSGFAKKIYQFFNIDLPRTAFEQSHVGLRVSRSELVEGDLLFFNTRRKLGHVGIYIGNNEFVHASSRKRGVRVDNLSMPYYDKRFVRAVRLKGSDGGL